MRKLILLMALWLTPAEAQPMYFEAIRNGGNCVGCAYTQASGEITDQTAKEFDSFARSQEFGTGPVRLNSVGGSLLGGIVLGELFRSTGVLTEVGSSAPIRDGRAIAPGIADRAPGICSSACAYAFLGGTERSLDENAKLGFHRFYQENTLADPAAKLFTGKDIGDAQITTAALVLYILKMGVDPSLISLASEAGPNEMRWVSKDEAQKLRITYEPWAYKPWRVEPYRGGAVAIAESNDGLKSVVVSCSTQSGPSVTIINSKPAWDVASWFEQCRIAEPPGGHPVLGTFVNASRVRVIRRKDGGVLMRFQLPTYDPRLTSAALLSGQVGYPKACSTNEYQASNENFVANVRLALRNCFQD
jgi:hypothetical protein